MPIGVQGDVRGKRRGDWGEVLVSEIDKRDRAGRGRTRARIRNRGREGDRVSRNESADVRRTRDHGYIDGCERT